MTTLANAMLDVARKVTDVVEGTATGGSATTLIDTNFPRRINSSGDFPPTGRYVGGPIWFKSGNKSGRTQVVTGWAPGTQTLTFADHTPTSGAVAVGDQYAVADRDYPIDQLRQGVNQAMANIEGLMLRYEDAAFLTVVDQLAYNLAAGVYNLKRVEIATSLIAPYYYVEHFAWEEIGTQLVFHEGQQPPAAGYRIRLTYLPVQAELSADTTDIVNRIVPLYIAWEGAVSCFTWKLRQLGPNADKGLTGQIANALRQASEMAGRFRPQLGQKPRAATMSIWAQALSSEYDDPTYQDLVHL